MPDEDDSTAIEGRPNKSVYIITFFEKELVNKVTKICDSFTSERFEIPDTTQDKKALNQKIEEVKKNIEDSRSVLNKTRQNLRD